MNTNEFKRCDPESSFIWFAIHLDANSAIGGETVWALPCKDEAADAPKLFLVDC
jgi:hypothetical protein